MFSILWPIGKYLGMQIHEKLYGFLTVKNEMEISRLIDNLLILFCFGQRIT